MSTTRLLATDEESLFQFVSTSTPGTAVEVNVSDDMSEDALRKRLTIAGFIDIQATGAGTMSARLPDYTKGTAVSLSAAPAASAWMEALSRDSRGTELIDEDALLEGDGFVDGIGGACAPPKADGGKRKPCKNCSCGLADIMADDGESGRPNQKAIPMVPTDQTKSGCGSCSLGDAFRCAACPYLGLPPFKAGEKVAVPTSLMTSDI